MSRAIQMHSVTRLWRVADENQDCPYAVQAIWDSSPTEAVAVWHLQWQTATVRQLAYFGSGAWVFFILIPPLDMTWGTCVHGPLLQRVFLTFILILSSDIFALLNCRFPRLFTANVIHTLLKTTDAEISNGKSDISRPLLWFSQINLLLALSDSSEPLRHIFTEYSWYKLGRVLKRWREKNQKMCYTEISSGRQRSRLQYGPRHSYLPTVVWRHAVAGNKFHLPNLFVIVVWTCELWTEQRQNLYF